MSTANLASVLTQSETALAAVIHQAADRLDDVGLHVGAALARLEESKLKALHRLRQAQSAARDLLADVASFAEVMADGLLAELEVQPLQTPAEVERDAEIGRTEWELRQQAACPAQIGPHATLSRPLVSTVNQFPTAAQEAPASQGPPEDEDADSEGGETDSVDMVATSPEAIEALTNRILGDFANHQNGHREEKKREESQARKPPRKRKR